MSQHRQNQARGSESFALRTKSKELLESAKRAVEITIKEGEEKAMGWLEALTLPSPNGRGKNRPAKKSSKTG